MYLWLLRCTTVLLAASPVFLRRVLDLFTW